MNNSLIGLCFGMGVEDHQKDRAQLGIEAINRREQMVYSEDRHPNTCNKLDTIRV